MRLINGLLIVIFLAQTSSAQWLFGVWPKPKVPFPMTVYQYEVELLERPKPATAGTGYPIEFRVRPLGKRSHQVDAPPPVRVTLFAAAERNRQQQHWLFPDEQGVYRAVVPIPRPGPYQVFFETGSKRWTIVKVPMFLIDAARSN